MVRRGSGVLAFFGEEETTRKSIVATAPPEAQISGGTLAANNPWQAQKRKATFRTASPYCTKIGLWAASLFC